MSEYVIYYDPEGNPASITRGNTSIPIDDRNRDFRKFLTWNAAQETPLDWQTPIEAVKVEPVPSQAEEIAALKVMVKRLAGGTETTVEEVALMEKTGLVTKEEAAAFVIEEPMQDG